MATTPLYCTNHPSVETLLRCNRCGNPYCVRCLVRTPVGYRCRTCLNIQQAGYYTATSLDYAIAGLVSFGASAVGGWIATIVSGIFFLFVIFYAPASGGAISELTSRAIRRRRGRYIWLLACAAFLIGSAFGAVFLPVTAALLLGHGPVFATLVRASFALFNLGFLIYLVLAIGTVYARLR